MPICIAGMHRSGTSMVASLLHQCGLFLGPDPADYHAEADDNPEGFWEHRGFLHVNDQVLRLLGGGWDFVPDFPAGWEKRPELTHARAEAAQLIGTFAGREPWGWKDPRTSLTLPFWSLLLPNLKVLVCVRNPLEVIRSLQKRGYASFAFGQNLWLRHNRQLLDQLKWDERLVTHTDVYFHDPAGELRRIVDLLGLPVSDRTIQQACSVITAPLRHHRLSQEEMLEAGVSVETLSCYRELCLSAGPVYQRVLGLESGDIDWPPRQPVEELHQARRELRAVRGQVLRLEERLSARRHRWAERLGEAWTWLRQRFSKVRIQGPVIRSRVRK